MNDEYIEGFGTVASILDKTDWRKTIHKCMERCVFAEGKVYYPNTVKSLVSAVSANYPGFLAKNNIDEYTAMLKEKYRLKTQIFILKNPDYWYHPGKRNLVEPEFRNDYYKELFEYIKNLLANKRILLYGSRRIKGGQQMPDE
jgi:hypothetical protein